MDERHINTREVVLVKFERDQYEILDQCGKDRDVLYTNFRYDQICQAYTKFKALGISEKTLMKLLFTLNLRVLYSAFHGYSIPLTFD